MGNEQSFYSGHHPRLSIQWCDLQGSPVSIVGPRPSPLMVSRGQVLASPRDVIFRDPSSFVPGELHKIITNGKGLFLWVRRKKSSLSFGMGLMSSDISGRLKGSSRGSATTQLIHLPENSRIVHPVSVSRILFMPLLRRESVQVP